jgi:hypothetical protein
MREGVPVAADVSRIDQWANRNGVPRVDTPFEKLERYL